MYLVNKKGFTMLNNIARVSDLIGKKLSCRERECRIEADLTRYNFYSPFFRSLG